QPAPDTQSLRREIDALKADYEQRIKALEQRLQAAEDALKAQPAAAAAAPAAAAPAAAGPAPLPPTAVAPAPEQPATTARASTAPLLETSLILSGQYTRTSRDPADYRIRGFPLPPDAEIGPRTRGF